MIVLSPFSTKLHNGKLNPKSPMPDWWRQLLAIIDASIVQIGVNGEQQLTTDFRQNLSFESIKKLVKESQTWISVDNFLPHLAHHCGVSGVVVWSRSDPRIFGYDENYNILKSEQYLRKDSFGMWESESYIQDAFPDVAYVASIIKQRIKAVPV